MTSPLLSVSRETMEGLRCYESLLKKWNPAINLVSKASMLDLWDRHIWDSAQVCEYADRHTNWLDIGSGGGFPGLIVAILAKEKHPERQVSMLESDSRKSTFLQTVIRELDLKASVKVGRIEEFPPENCDVLSARALASLDQLLHFADRHLHPTGRALFFKGESWEEEVVTARRSWSFDFKAHKSKTNTKAVILEIKDVQLV